VGSCEIGALQIRAVEICLAEHGAFEPGALKERFSQRRAGEIRAIEARAFELGAVHLSGTQVRPGQRGLREMGSAWVRALEPFTVASLAFDTFSSDLIHRDLFRFRAVHLMGYSRSSARCSSAPVRFVAPSESARAPRRGRLPRVALEGRSLREL